MYEMICCTSYILVPIEYSLTRHCRHLLGSPRLRWADYFTYAITLLVNLTASLMKKVAHAQFTGRTRSGRLGLHNIPQELFLLILSHLSPRDIASMALVSRPFWDVSVHQLWRVLPEMEDNEHLVSLLPKGLINRTTEGTLGVRQGRPFEIFRNAY